MDTKGALEEYYSIPKNQRARYFKKKWSINSNHERAGENGCWYAHPTGFPFALIDPYGFIIFNTKEDYINCPQLKHGKQLNVTKPGISGIAGYVRKA